MHVYAHAMSAMEKRLQLLLDAQRFELVSAEAARSGRSVASVIREAIDVRFEVAEQEARRTRALDEFLALAVDETGPPEDVVSDLHREFDDHLNRKGGA